MEDFSVRSASTAMTFGSASHHRSSTEDIGTRVEKAKVHSTKPKFWNKLRWVVVAMIIFFVIIHATVALLQAFVINQFFVDHSDRFGEQETQRNANPSLNVARKVVPAVSAWYHSLDEDEIMFGIDTITGFGVQTRNENEAKLLDVTCLDSFFGTIMESAHSTSPELIELVLSNMGLQDHMPTRNHLAQLLTEPQDLFEDLNRTYNCVSHTYPLAGLCQVAKQFGIDFTSKREGRKKHDDVREYLLNVWAVHEALTTAATSQLWFLSSLSRASSERQKDVEEAVRSGLTGRRAPMASRVLNEAERAFNTLGFMTSLLKSNPDFKGFKDMTQLRILDNVRIDAFAGRRSNAMVGLFLATTLSTIPFSSENQEFVWRLGTEWTEAYIAWRFALLTSTESLHHLVGLVTPSIVCAVVEDDDSFLAANVISNALSHMHLPPPQFSLTSGVSTSGSADIYESSKPTGNNSLHKTKLDNIFEFLQSQFSNRSFNPEKRAQLADLMGESNMQRIRLPNVSKRHISMEFGRLCGKGCVTDPWIVTDASPHANLDDDDFLVYVTVVVWLTVLISGLGCELLLWVILSQCGWSEELETRWWFAQFCFPLFAMTCFGLATLQNYLALPFLVAGLWKFGMPETLSYMYTALFGRHRTCMGRVADLLNSVGTIMHHSSATSVICALLTGIVTSDRYIMGPILILIMQHWFVLTKYVSVWLYAGLELILEGWFQLVLLSDLQHLQEMHWTVSYAALGMFTAHWLYLIGAGLELFFVSKPCADDNDDEESSGTRIAKVLLNTKPVHHVRGGDALKSFNVNKISGRSQMRNGESSLRRFLALWSGRLLSVAEVPTEFDDCSNSSEYEA